MAAEPPLHCEKGTITADRGFGHAVPFAGLRVEGPAGGRWTVAAGAKATLPIPVKTPPFVVPVEAEAACRIWRGPGSEGAQVLGLFYEGNFFHDAQRTPNQAASSWGRRSRSGSAWTSDPPGASPPPCRTGAVE